jgi:N-methylhydantoinase A
LDEAATRSGDAGAAPGDALLGVDVGGTFTDAVLVAGARVHTAKVPTTPSDQSQGVMAAVELVLGQAGAEPSQLARFAHGMTVGTNALLEQRGARTALLATEGFTDVIELARQTRPELYRPCRDRPAPLVPPQLRFAVRERTGPGGVMPPIDEQALETAVENLAGADVEAVAVALLHSYADASHERQVAHAVGRRLPGVHVSTSHELVNVFREFERTSTTVIDAYLSPLMGEYLRRLQQRAEDAGLPEPQIMQSSGGLMSAPAAARHAAWTVLSGPAGGAVGAAYAATLSGHEDVLSFDMGGTSCDVAVVDGGRVRQTAARTIAGRPLQLPMVDVHTVGAGGGSIGWADAGGALRVGPQSAGAEPGPACYGRGGEQATVTDANLALGYLSPGESLAGGVRLDGEAAMQALGRLGERVGLGPIETAAGIVRVADQEMLRALRVVTVERGVDPRGYALVAFGGAGPMHAARLAEQLEIGRVLLPRAAGVLSALGLVVSESRRDVARSVLLAGESLSEDRVEAVVRELGSLLDEELPGAEVEVTFDLRYRGQSFELPVAAPERPSPQLLREAFERANRERYGYVDPEAELELVNVRAAAAAGTATPELQAGTGAGAISSERAAWFDGRQLQIEVLSGELDPGDRVQGPAVCELPEATVVVPPGWRGSVDDAGMLSLERER